MLSDSRKRSRSSRAFAWIPPETLILAGAGAFAALGRGRWVTLIGDHGLWYSELQGLLCGGHLMHEVRVPYGPISMWLIWLAARLFGPTISTVAGFVFVAGLAAVVLRGAPRRRHPLEPGGGQSVVSIRVRDRAGHGVRARRPVCPAGGAAPGIVSAGGRRRGRGEARCLARPGRPAGPPLHAAGIGPSLELEDDGRLEDDALRPLRETVLSL